MRAPGELSKLSDVELKSLQGELLAELAQREAGDRALTLSDLEVQVARVQRDSGTPAYQAIISRLGPEKPRAKNCPKCGRLVRVKVRDRERTILSLCGHVTFKRNYHYCDDCALGFYPRDRELKLPEEGTLTVEMEKRVLDFSINGPFEEQAERWSVHYAVPVSSKTLRAVTDRVGVRCQAADRETLHRVLLPPPAQPPQVLVVATDGSMLPMRGPEPWKEAKVAVMFRDEHHLSHRQAKRGAVTQARYVATLGGQNVFRQELSAALAMERADEAQTVVWLGDGAPSNWTLADEIRHGAVQILDWHHAVEHAMACGKVLLGDDSPFLPVWKMRMESLLMVGDMNATITELMACLFGTKHEGKKAINDLVRYFRTNEKRMRYAEFIDAGYPIGSGFVESAHRHVLQTRMKCSGQHWSQVRAHRMAMLRAAYRTAGAAHCHGAICQAARAA
jgi:hypothetical protein